MPEQEPPEHLEPQGAGHGSPLLPVSAQLRMDALSDALARMVRRQSQVEARLDRIEQAVALHAPEQPLAAPRPELAAVEMSPPPLPAAAPAPPSPPPLPEYVLTPEPSPAAVPALETRFGLNWLNRIAVVTLVFGVGFFFKYAVDNQWIGPETRVALGVAAAIASLAAGEWMSIRGQVVFARGLTGLGLAVLYLSFYATFGFYQVLPESVAFLLMTVTTISAGGLAFYYDSRVVAILGLMGGYLTPALLSTGENRVWTLAGYTLLLNVGALILARLRRWPSIAHVALAGSYLLYIGWADRWLADATRPAAFAWLSATFVVYLLLGSSAGPSGAGLWMPALNAGAYFTAAYLTLRVAYHDWMGAFALALGILHAGWAKFLSDRASRHLAIAIAAAFLTLAIPIQFTGFRVTISWALEAVAFAWVARRLDDRRPEIGAGLVLFFVFFRLLGWDSRIHAAQFFNPRLLTFAVSAASFWLVSRCLKAKQAGAIAYCAGHIVLLWGLSLEVVAWARRTARPAEVNSTTTIVISILMAVYALGLIAAGTATRRALNRLLGLALIGIVVAKLYLIDVWDLSRGFRITAFLGLGMLLLLVSYLYSRFKPAVKKIWKDRS
jgi:uncharacterized membrane protein